MVKHPMKRFSKRRVRRVGRHFGPRRPKPTTERLLATESLEQRALLTTYVEMRLDITSPDDPQTFNVDEGTPLSTVTQGSHVELRGYVQDVRNDPDPDLIAGMYSSFMHVGYDDSLFSIAAAPIRVWPYSVEVGNSFLPAPGAIINAGGVFSPAATINDISADEMLMFRLPLSVDDSPLDAINDDASTDPALRIGAGTVPHEFDVMSNDTFVGQATFSADLGSFVTLYLDPSTYEEPVPAADVNFTGVTVDVTGGGTPFISRAGPSVNPGTANLSDKGGTVLITGGGQRITYTPPASMNSLAAGETDTDTFSYEVSNGSGRTDIAVVTVTIFGSAPSQVDISLNPNRTDVHPVTGETATVPDSRTWLDAWEDYWVEIWVSTPRSSNVGIASASVDLAYDTTYHTATQVEYGPGFTPDGQETIDNANGEVLNIAGTTSGGDIGDDGVALLARVRFERTGENVTNNAIGQYMTPVATLTTEMTRFEAILDGQGQPEPAGTASSNVAVDLWPVMYDLNSDGAINFADFSFFTVPFLDYIEFNDKAYESDFDRSGRVDFSDFAFFTPNFGLTSESTKSRQYPPGFPDDWVSTLGVSAAFAPNGDAAPLTEDQLSSVVDAAVTRVESNSLNQSAVSQFDDVTVEIVDLPGNLLGLADDGARTIQIDVDAAGYGWFVDTTPMDNEEFVATVSSHERSALPGGAAAGRVDLLTVVMHELGHLLGHADDDGHSLMESTLPTGTRRLADFSVENDVETLDQAFAALDDGM